jgi:tetratricopeptide (TPR) repeat protein
MRASLLLLACVCVGLPALAQPPAPPRPPILQVPSAPPLETLLKRTTELYYFHRHEAGVVQQIKSTLEQAARQYGETYEVCWQLSRLYWWMADGEDDYSKMATLARTGWDWAEKAVKLRPDGVEGNLFLATNIGQYSLGIGVVRALANGLEGKFLAPLDKAIRLNPRIECAGPLRLKGNYYQNLPWIKQDLDAALKLLRQSLQLEPCAERSRLNIAETLEKKGDIAGALVEVEKVLSARPNSVDPGDLPRIQARARITKKRLSP